MLNSSLLENKSMSGKNLIEIENTSPVALHGLNPGGRIKILVDRDGVPVDREWRRRMRDSKIDNCIAIVEKKKEKKGE